MQNYSTLSNGIIDKFMKVVSKAIKTSIYKNRNWKDDLHDVLPSFRSSIHNSIQESTYKNVTNTFSNSSQDRNWRQSNSKTSWQRNKTPAEMNYSET